jgi:2-oxoglutarate dehydrogenase E2 component (dihydrolipoamide succinyltransferase)
MAQVELIMPKMGESIMEATILKWVKQVGDSVDVDETILEIATDKVDSEVPSPVAGVIAKILFQEDETIEIGKTIAIIATEGEEVASESIPSAHEATAGNGVNQELVKEEKTTVEEIAPLVAVAQPAASLTKTSESGRFYSPLVKNIALKENIGIKELETVLGTGKDGRVTKKDILDYISNRTAPSVQSTQQAISVPSPASISSAPSLNGNTEIVEMDRMRRLIADHMVMSKQTSAHVTSFVEIDVTNIVNWRNRIKNEYQTKHGEKITFTPIFIDAVVKAIRDFPMVNISIEGKNIIVKKDINIGMAAALPSGNLIVPVIKNADRLNLIGLTSAVNDLAGRARTNKLKPEEIQGGTFTLTNVGTFGNVMGTPIINQPQVAILAVGAIRKKPAVVETEYGDLIAVRHMMFLSLSYDHRVVDGFLGGSFLRKVGDYLEAFDAKQTI